jgi:hypothetical protein
MVEWYWQGKTEVLGEKHCTVWVAGEWMSMEQWCRIADRELKQLQCPIAIMFITNPTYTGLGFEPGPSRWEARDLPPNSWDGPQSMRFDRFTEGKIYWDRWVVTSCSLVGGQWRYRRTWFLSLRMYVPTISHWPHSKTRTGLRKVPSLVLGLLVPSFGP